ncbi:MAG TPA: PAS domain S-box protein [Puia sp.]|nr:PAS domain S-box protein [Puia sp.]
MKKPTKYFVPIISFSLMILAAILFFTYQQASRAKSAAASALHAQEMLFHTAQVLALATVSEVCSRDFILTGQGVFLESMRDSKDNILKQIDTLRILSTYNAAQRLRIDSLLMYINKVNDLSESRITLKTVKGMLPALQLVSSDLGESYINGTRQIVKKMQYEETRLLQETKIATKKATVLLNWLIFSFLIYILVLFIIFLRRDWLYIKVINRIEETLKKSEERFRLLVSNAKDYAIIMLDSSGRIVSWNSGAERIKGYGEQEIIGKFFEVFYRKEDIEKGEPYHNLEMANINGHYEKEGLRLRKDGSTFWANILITALVDDTGKLCGYSKITRDITERKKTHEELESRLRQINLSNDAIYTLGSNLKVKTWNCGAENMYGYAEVEALGRDPHKILNTSYKTEEPKSIGGALAGQDHWVGELKRKSKSGKDIYINNSTTTIRDDQGKISGYVVVDLDITRQKYLREQVNHLATIIEHSIEAIISTGSDRRIISWNKGAEELFGYSKGEAIGSTSAELGYTRLAENEISEIEQQVFEGGTWKAERNYFNKDGSSFFGAVTSNSIKNERGETTAIISIIRDISKRKQMEEELMKLNEDLEIKVQQRTQKIYKNEKRFRALIENNSDVISLMDESFRIIYQSPSAARITGWTNDEMQKIESKKMITHPDDKEIFANMLKEIIANPDKQVNVFYRSLHKNGHYIWLEGVLTNLLSDENVKGLVFNYHDVTERVEEHRKLLSSEVRYRKLEQERMESKMEEQKKIAQAILHGQEKERNAIGAELHDNVNQILAGTNLFLAIAKKNPEKRMEHIESSMQYIQQAIEANRRIAHELVSPDFEEIRLVELLNGLTNNMLKKAGIDVYINTSSLDEDLLNGEKKLAIYRIAQEQCSNIIKYAQTRSVTVSLSTADDFFKMIIADDGKGMEAGKKAYGIGLRNIKGRLSIFNGEANIITSEGNGFRLEIDIPL